MEISEETVQKIQKFVQNRQAAEKEASQEPFSATALHAYARRLDGTLQQLQEQVRRQEHELKRVNRASQIRKSCTNLTFENSSSSGKAVAPMAFWMTMTTLGCGFLKLGAPKRPTTPSY